LALVCLVGNLVALIHGAVVPHVSCPDHGELIHVAPATAGAQTRAQAALTEDSHDRCLCPLEEQQAPLAPPRAPVSLASQGRDVSRPANSDRPFVLAPLVLAPKHGPPSRASRV
jgi:hypothetical protein